MINYQTRIIAGQPFGEIGGKTLETAIKNIEERFVCVGLTDQFDASLLLMARLLNLKNIYYSRWNKGRNKKPLAPEKLEELKKKPPQGCLLDRELYDFSKQRLKTQLADNGIDEKAVLNYLSKNVDYQEDILYQQQMIFEEGLASLNSIEADFNRRVTEFNSLILVRLLRMLKRPFFLRQLKKPLRRPASPP